MWEGDEEQFRLIAESSRDMISRTDARGVCTYVSPACRDVLGYEPEELVGMSLFDLVPPDLASRNRALFDRAIATGTLMGGAFVTPLRRKDGKYAWIESTSQLLRDAEGRVVAIQASGRDVSERVVAEEALAQSEKNFRTMIDQLPYGVVVHREGRFVYANASFARLLGRDAGSLIGSRVLDVVAPEDRERIRAHIQGPRRPVAVMPEHRLIGADGQHVVVQVTGMPTVFEGELVSIAVVEDLSPRKALETELMAADRMAALGKLAASVGHEINNPLAYVVAHLELLRADVTALGPATKAIAERLSVIEEGVERVRSIVADLRSFSSVHEGGLGAVEPTPAVERALATASHEIRLRARVVRDLRATRAVRAEERRLVQVLVNLLVNAAQAIHHGSADENEIGLVTRDEPDGSVSIVVWDTGVGIPNGDTAKLFDPFFTTKRDQAGTGLGLSISHRIVTSFGGTIHAERRPSRGSSFRITLPSARIEDNAEVKATTPSAPKAEKKLRVLLVDDEQRFACVVAALLVGHDVVVEHSGRAASERLTSDARFDVVVCDLQMPDGSGADVWEHARITQPGLERRFVFMTGGVFTAQARAFVRDCAQPILEKPFASAALLATISRIARQQADS